MNLQELAQRGPVRQGFVSTVDRHLYDMDADTRALASKLLTETIELDDKKTCAYSDTEVAAALTGSGFPVGRSAVGEWRKKNGVR